MLCFATTPVRDHFAGLNNRDARNGKNYERRPFALFPFFPVLATGVSELLPSGSDEAPPFFANFPPIFLAFFESELVSLLAFFVLLAPNSSLMSARSSMSIRPIDMDISTGGGVGLGGFVGAGTGGFVGATTGAFVGDAVVTGAGSTDEGGDAVGAVVGGPTPKSGQTSRLGGPRSVYTTRNADNRQVRYARIRKPGP